MTGGAAAPPWCGWRPPDLTWPLRSGRLIASPSALSLETRAGAGLYYICLFMCPSSRRVYNPPASFRPHQRAIITATKTAAPTTKRVARSTAARRASGPPAMSGPKRERDPVCDVCGHCHVQGVKCTICGHVGKYIGAARLARPHTATRICTHAAAPAHTPQRMRIHAEWRPCRAVPGGPNRPNRGAIPPVPPGPVHNPNLTPPTIEGITVAEFQRVSCRTPAGRTPAAASGSAHC